MIVFGSRGSDLALAQTRQVAKTVEQRTGEPFRIEVIETRGDRELGRPLPELGGKGLFTAELEEALRRGTIDAAVHSMKDLPVDEAPGLRIGAVPPRAAAEDVLVFDPAHEDPEGGSVPLRGNAKVGTSSPRRRSALLGLRSDLVAADVRGNVPTRVDKVRRGDYAGVLLAAAGLDRLGLDLGGLRRVSLPVARCTPAPGQGALGVQARSDDRRVAALLETIHDGDTAACDAIERRTLARLGGGCSMPFGALARIDADGFDVRASLYAPRCGDAITTAVRGADADAIVAELTAQFAPFVGEPLGGQGVCLFRSGADGGPLAAALAVAGADVVAVPLTECLPVHPAPGALAAAARTCPILAFTSARAVDRFCEELAFDRAGAASQRIYAGGPATGHALRSRGLECVEPRDGAGGAALAACVRANEDGPANVLFPCAEERHGAFEREMQAAGFEVVAVPLYRTVPAAGVELPSTAGRISVFTSPSAVDAFTASGGVQDGPCIALGPTTAGALEARGLPCAAVAETPTARALLTRIQELSDARTS